jgi:hypothetical protein
MLGFVDKKGFPNQLVSDPKPHLLSRSDHRRSAARLRLIP